MNLHTNLDLTAETAEIAKTAPKTQQNPKKIRKKVAETAEIPQTAPQTIIYPRK